MRHSHSHLKDSLLDFENGDIEGSSAEIVDGDDFVVGFVETVGQSSGSRLVDHSENVETGDLTWNERRFEKTKESKFCAETNVVV